MVATGGSSVVHACILYHIYVNPTRCAILMFSPFDSLVVVDVSAFFKKAAPTTNCCSEYTLVCTRVDRKPAIATNIVLLGLLLSVL